MNWLKDNDMLPQMLPRARIMTYGYNAPSALVSTTADLRDNTVKFLNWVGTVRMDVSLLFEEVAEGGG